MIDQFNEAIEAYQQAWQRLLAARADQAFFAQLRPVSAGWKVADLTTFDTILTALRQHSDHIHQVHKNNRWLATVHLRDVRLEWDIEVATIMERRPNSEDATGLDNIGFYVPHFALLEEVLAKEPDLKWTHESNGPHSSWISLWFDGYEAKLRTDNVLDVGIRELRAIRDDVMKEPT